MANPKRIALLGGSFNPPHVAHQMVCAWVLKANKVDQVWLVPCFQHAFGKPLIEFVHRMEMCRRIADSFASGQVEVSDVEKEIGGKSRTLITLEHLSSQ
ncbi:MAG: nicotinate-nicotinamide nucleotide adenylyltransferase, partial [Pseudomonadota bacterium]